MPGLEPGMIGNPPADRCRDRNREDQAMPKTSRDIEMNLWGKVCTIPAGTRVHSIAGIGGGWVISSAKLLIELSGNTHDPVYRYAWINESDVDKEA